jgi:hypothetical protein
LITGVVSEALRRSYEVVQHPTLQSLSHAIPEVIEKSKSVNTNKKYNRGFERWQSWSSKFKEVTVLPASGIYLSLFFIQLIQTCVSVSIIDECHYGITWVHKLTGFDDPCKFPIVSEILEAAKRILSEPVRKKEPINPENMLMLFNRFGGEHANLSDLRTLTLCSLGYAGFLRFSELISLKVCDFEFQPSLMRVFIEKSKTDIYRDGAHVVIAASGKSTCPVAICKRYFAVANFDSKSDEHIFRPLTFMPSSKSKYKFRNLNSLSYTRTREIVLGAFESIGLDKTKFGLHSLRAGGASAAANSNISDRLFKRHGRWKSDKAKDGYIKDNVEALLSVSRALGV